MPVVLITGAAGNLGSKLRSHMEALGWTLKLVDRDDQGDPSIVAADLSAWDDGWASLFKGVDAVVHLAGNPSPRGSWASIQRLNLDLTQNVYEAASRAGVARFVFASSNWVVAGYRDEDEPLTPDLDPAPVNAYGASKLFGERLGRSYHERWGLSVVCLRIGFCQRGENRPGPQMEMGLWGQAMWLSDRDFCHGIERAVLADGVGFSVLNLMSDNPGMRWDLAETRRLLAYAPQDGATPLSPD
ncbi:NAD-dependent epimerase/dehydratase family protein [Bosea thiooxidans]